MWNDERVARLKVLWAEGLSCSKIAAELGGATRNAVIGKVTRLGLDKRGKTPARRGSNRVEARNRQRSSRVAAHMPRRVAQALAPELPALPEEDPRSLPPLRTFDELKPNECRYPTGNGAAMRFCGRDGHPWCRQHEQVVYTPVRRR